MKMWKRITSLVLVLCMMLPMFCFSAGALDAGGETTVTAGTEVTLNGSGRNKLYHSWTVVDAEGNTDTATVTSAPSYYDHWNATFTSDVPGTYTVTHTYGFSDGKKETFTIIVEAAAPTLTVTASINGDAVQLSGTGNAYSAPETTLYVGDASLNTATLAADATKSGTDYTNYTKEWTVSGDAVSFNETTGTVTALAVGPATVTAKFTSTTDDSDIVTVTFPITVDVPRLVITAKINGTSQTLSGSDTDKTVDESASVAVKAEATLSVTATKGSASYAVSWNSENSAIAKVDEDGVVTGVSIGSTNVIASFTVSGVAYTVTFPVTVAQASGVRAYFYLWSTNNTEAFGTQGGTWAPFGRGDLDPKYIKPATEDTTTEREDPQNNKDGIFTLPENVSVSDLVLWTSPDFPTKTSAPSYSGTTENSSTSTKDYPTFVVNGITYYYYADPTQGDADGLADDKWSTYHIEWVRIKKCAGANATGYDNWLGSSVDAWHVDGTVVLDDKVTVIYKVLYPDAENDTDFRVLDNRTFSTWPKTIVETLYTNNKFDGLGTETYNGKDYVFDGWYYDSTYQKKVVSENVAISTKDNDGSAETSIVYVYGKFKADVKTVTYVYLSDFSEPDNYVTITKKYNCYAGDYIPLPYGPDCGSMYFAGWSYQNKDGSIGSSRGNGTAVKWVADAADPDNMTITASYYTDTVGTYTVADGAAESLPTYAIQSGGTYANANKGKISTPLFGDLQIKEENGTAYLYVQFNPDNGFTSVDPVQDDSNDADTGTIVAKNYEYKQVGFVLSKILEASATSPTVQGGYDFTASNDLFRYQANGVALGDGVYIVIMLDDSIDLSKTTQYCATPYAIGADGVYHYGTAGNLNQIAPKNN